ncbi:MAG: hypothetical protein AAB388_03875 [Patescibacteria group bacterium]
MERAPQFEAETNENVESNEAWRALKEQAPTEARTLVEERLGESIEAAPASKAVEVLKELIADRKDDNDHRFVVEEFAKLLAAAHSRLSFEQSMAPLTSKSMREAA